MEDVKTFEPRLWSGVGTGRFTRDKLECVDGWLYIPEAVNPDETGRRDNYCVGETSMGLLIQASPGNDGGAGAWRTKRSG